jgi:hypothetical protein
MYFYKFINVIYDKITYKNTVFIGGNLQINTKNIYLHKLKNKLYQTGFL